MQLSSTIPCVHSTGGESLNLLVCMTSMFFMGMADGEARDPGRRSSSTKSDSIPSSDLKWMMMIIIIVIVMITTPKTSKKQKTREKTRILTLIQLDRIPQPSPNTSGGILSFSLSLVSLSLLVKRYEVCKPCERVSAK